MRWSLLGFAGHPARSKIQMETAKDRQTPPPKKKKALEPSTVPDAKKRLSTARERHGQQQESATLETLAAVGATPVTAGVQLSNFGFLSCPCTSPPAAKQRLLIPTFGPGT